MIKKLDESHNLILDFLEKNKGLRDNGLREIAKIAKLSHPQKALNKINQLEKMGYIRKNYENGKYEIFKSHPIPEFVTIPVYSSDQFGKKGFEIPKTEPIKKVKIPSDILGISGNEEYFFVKAKGKFGLPIIKHDDLVLVRKENAFEVGKKYLIIHENKPKIKVLHKIGKKERFVSNNCNIDKEEPLTTKDVQILGAPKKLITSI